MRHINITLCTPSAIEFNGLCAVLRNIRDTSLSFRSIEPSALLNGSGVPSNTDLLICDPIAVSTDALLKIRETGQKNLKIALLYHSALPVDYVKSFDAVISIYDSELMIEQTVTSLFASRSGVKSDAELTQREKEILVGVVKGLANKEIASELNLSVNTVMTHRRNIAAKLEIHSAAGLTVYALMSGLVNLDEIAAN